MVNAPDEGDIVWLNFDPQAGREQSGKRPALVLSPKSYNQKSELAVVCPITSKSKGYAFEVALPMGLAISGVILSDHIKSIDWKARNIIFIDRASDEVLEDVRAKISALLGMD